MFKRKIYESLIRWKESGLCKKKAAFVKGLRQVGKTFAVTEFANSNYENVVYIDFKRNTSAKAAFAGDIDVDRITLMLTAVIHDAKFVPGKTVIILDEVQACSRARFSIKAFIEDGRYDIIATGSLLGIKGYNRKNSDVPVGFEHTIRMYPMDFEEFLWACGTSDDILSYVRDCYTNRKKVGEPIHSKLLDMFSRYICVGGMPAVVRTFIERNDMNEVRRDQLDLLEQYRDDFGKHLDENEEEVFDADMLERINLVFDSIPSQLSKENKKFQYSKLSKNARGKKYDPAIQWLVDYGLAVRSCNLSLLQLPLSGNKEDSTFKLYMADSGLLVSMLEKGTCAKIMSGDLYIYKGAIFENVISEILRNNSARLYYYHRDSGLEVDFVSYYDSEICLIEVKSTTGNSKSAKTLLQEHPDDIRICFKFGQHNVGFMNGILTLPVYMAPLVASELSDV